MTNAMIILMESCRLMEAGIIGTTGRSFEIEDENGNRKIIMEPEPIHTYAVWKSLGYQVKRGEKNVAAINIWKTGKGKQNPEAEEGDQDGEKSNKLRLFRKTAFFFKQSQCELIAG